MRKPVLIAGLIAGSLCSSPYLLADTQAQPAKNVQVQKSVKKSSSMADRKAIIKQINKQKALLKETNQQVGKGLSNVFKAMKMIQQNNDKAAISALEAASGAFDIALAENPQLGLVPVDFGISVNEYLTTPDQLKDQIKLAKKLLDKYQVQEAREVVLPMKDDLEISVVSLPMQTYPDAIKNATKLLVDGHRDDAIAMLETALSSVVTEESTIPLALVRAERMVEDAANIKSHDKAGKETALSLLNDAEEQLNLAVLFGYTSKHSELYKDDLKQIKELKKEIKGGNAVEKLYEKLKGSLEKTLSHHSSDKRIVKGKKDSR